MKLPSLQFYPGDWLKDPKLRSVSLAARGLWMDMLCLMHENDRRGYLQLGSGKPVTAEHLARMTGCSPDDASRLLQELEDSGVYSRTEQDVIYNRRMVRDDQKRRLCSEAGKKGGGNPTFKGQTKGDSKGRDKGGAKASSSASTSVVEVGEEEGAALRLVESIAWTPDAGWTGISDTDRASWRAAYPACDINRQLAAMHEWLMRNPEKAHKRRWGRFVTNWMARSQEKGGDIQSRTTTAPTARRQAQEAREYD